MMASSQKMGIFLFPTFFFQLFHCKARLDIKKSWVVLVKMGPNFVGSTLFYSNNIKKSSETLQSNIGLDFE
jgi:hypothetical protein